MDLSRKIDAQSQREFLFLDLTKQESSIVRDALFDLCAARKPDFEPNRETDMMDDLAIQLQPSERGLTVMLSSTPELELLSRALGARTAYMGRVLKHMEIAAERVGNTDKVLATKERLASEYSMVEELWVGLGGALLSQVDLEN